MKQFEKPQLGKKIHIKIITNFIYHFLREFRNFYKSIKKKQKKQLNVFCHLDCVPEAQATALQQHKLLDDAALQWSTNDQGVILMPYRCRPLDFDAV